MRRGTPVQAALTVLLVLHLVAAVAGAVMIFTGYGVDAVDQARSFIGSLPRL